MPRTAASDLRARSVYARQPIRRPLPVIVFLHGGGWSGGTRTTGPDFRRFFAQDGFAMASIEYRLTPSRSLSRRRRGRQDGGPMAEGERRRARLDPDRICLWGTSAGGHLAAVAALAPRGPSKARKSAARQRRPLRARRLRTDAFRRHGRADAELSAAAPQSAGPAARRSDAAARRGAGGARDRSGGRGAARDGAARRSRVSRVAIAGRACPDRS